MPFAIPSAVKVGAVLVALLVVGAILYTVRAELIEKGKNIVYAEDNAARVKAQEEQAVRDRATLDSQRKYIERLELSGVQIKEQIRVVQAPCDKDGLGDPRLGLFDDWMRARRAGDNGAPNGGPPPQGAVPAPRK